MRGIPVNNATVQTSTDFGGYQKDPGFRGVDTDISALRQSAGQSVKLDRGIAVSEAEAGQAISGAVKGIGDGMTKLMQQRNDATNQRREYEARMAMDMEQDSIASALKLEPDETKWDGIVQTRLTAFQEKLLPKDLSPDARNAITQRFGVWSEFQKHNAVLRGTEQAFQKRADSSEAEMIRLSDNGQTEEAMQIGRDLVTIGAVKPQWLAEKEGQLKRRAEDKAEKARINAEATGAVTDPDWLEKNPKPREGQDATEYMQIRGLAERARADLRASASEELTNIILAPQEKESIIMTPEQIDRLEIPGLTPVMREEGKRMLGSLNHREAEAKRNGPEGTKAFAELWQRLKAWKPDSNKPEEFTGIMMEIRGRVPEDYAGELTMIAHGKWGGTPKDAPQSSEAKRYIDATRDSLFDPETGSSAWRKKTKDATGKESIVEDPAAKQRSIDAQFKYEKAMREWANQNPDKAEDVTAIKEASAKFLPGALLPPIPVKKSLKIEPFEPVRTELPQEQSAADPSLVLPPSNAKLTSFGYPNDETGDDFSRKGKATENRSLAAGDIAISPDIENQFSSSGIKLGDSILLELQNGETRKVRWQDRTAQDSDFKEGGKYYKSKIKGPLRGRFDFYSPEGKDPLDGMKIVGWKKA